jgi:hypothetical protein
MLLSLTVAPECKGAMVAYYPFDNHGNDVTGMNVNLNLVGNAGYGSSVSAGLGQALSLDGDGDGAIGGPFVKLTSNDATVVAWAYAESLAGDWNTIIKNWGTSAGGQFHLGLGSIAADTLQNFFRNNNTNTALNVLGTFPVQTWTHVAFVLDSVTLEHRLYINGSVAATGPYSGILGLGGATITGLGVGIKPNDNGTLVSDNGPGPWNGRIDDVGIFNEVLSDSRLLEIYQDGLQGIPLGVPEPAAMALCVLAVAAMSLRRHRAPR